MKLTEADRETLTETLPWSEGWPKSVDTGPGWFDLIAQLDEDLRTIYPDYTVSQVKEKYGDLRYYIEGVPEELDEPFSRRIGEAELASSLICEDCGEPGTRTSYGWIRVLCETHALEAKRRAALRRAKP